MKIEDHTVFWAKDDRRSHQQQTLRKKRKISVCALCHRSCLKLQNQPGCQVSFVFVEKDLIRGNKFKCFLKKAPNNKKIMAMGIPWVLPNLT